MSVCLHLKQFVQYAIEQYFFLSMQADFLSLTITQKWCHEWSLLSYTYSVGYVTCNIVSLIMRHYNSDQKILIRILICQIISFPSILVFYSIWTFFMKVSQSKIKHQTTSLPMATTVSLHKLQLWFAVGLRECC